MTASTFGSKNEPQYAAGDAPDVAVNPTEVAAYAGKVGNRRAGTTTERNAATGKDVWEGLEWYDTTTGGIYHRISSAWVTRFLPWTAYTPAWTSTGAAPTLGNSTLAGSWQRVGNLVNFTIYFKLGSTAGWGGGTYRFSLPVACKTGSTIRHPVPVFIEVSGSGYFAAVGIIQGGSSLVELISSTAGAGFLVSNSSPAWTANSVISIAGSYEVA